MNRYQRSDWDPRDPSVLRDQRGAFDAMRDRCPVAHSDFLGWSLFRHQDVSDVVADPETFSSASRHLAVPNGMDPPEHTRFREALRPPFDQERMNAFEPDCRRLARELLAPLAGRIDVEFMTAFADIFPLQAHCAFLGWPPETWVALQGWTHGNQEAALSRDRAAGAALARAFAGYVEDELNARRQPGAPTRDDVMSRLMETAVDGKPLSDEELVGALRNWTAGQGTVAVGIGNVVRYLAEQQDLQALLRREPGKIPAAIDEILRADGPLVANRRKTTRAVEIGGRAIATDEYLTLIWISADRDPDAFDEPDEVQIDRDPTANLLFGAGIHVCLGAPLARLEMRVAVEALFDATERFERDASKPLEWAVYPSNGVKSLPLRLHGPGRPRS